MEPPNPSRLLTLADSLRNRPREELLRTYVEYLGVGLASHVLLRKFVEQELRGPDQELPWDLREAARWARSGAPLLSFGPGSARILCAWPSSLQTREFGLLDAYALPVRWRQRPVSCTLPTSLTTFSSKVRTTVSQELDLNLDGWELDVEEGPIHRAAFDDLVPDAAQLGSAFAPLALSLVAVASGSRRGNPTIFSTGVWSQDLLAFTKVGDGGLARKVRAVIALGGTKFFVPTDNLAEASEARTPGTRLEISPLAGPRTRHAELARVLMTAALDLELAPDLQHDFEERRSYYLRWGDHGRMPEFYRRLLLSEIVQRCRDSLVAEGGSSLTMPAAGLVLTLGKDGPSAGLAALLIGVLRPRRLRIILSDAAKPAIRVLNGHLRVLELDPLRVGELVVAKPCVPGFENHLAAEDLGQFAGIDLNDEVAVREAHHRALRDLSGEGPVVVDTTGGNKLCTIAALETTEPPNLAIYVRHQLGGDEATAEGQDRPAHSPSPSPLGPGRGESGRRPLPIPGTERILILGLRSPRHPPPAWSASGMNAPGSGSASFLAAPDRPADRTSSQDSGSGRIIAAVAAAHPPATLRTTTLYLLNSPVLTSYGTFHFEGPMELAAARSLLKERFVSAIGHPATASLLEALLHCPIPVDRKAITLSPGDRALVFRLLDRLPEGFVATSAHLATLRYELALMTRIA